MTDWRTCVVGLDATVHRAIETIDASRLQICLVVDDQSRLVGTITDGDIRRAILRGVDMNASVDQAMNKNPKTAGRWTPDHERLDIMNKAFIRHIPIVDSDGRVVDLVTVDDLRQAAHRKENAVVLMAGGLGSRLHPLTEHLPKPLLPVGNKPLLETILEGFIGHDFHHFYIAVNYKAEMIKQYFGSGEKWGVSIEYLEEEERLGTAGALGLLRTPPAEPLIVMNADLLTHVNFVHLLDYHASHNAMATMCVREYDYQIPFGVVDVVDNRLRGIEEKPAHRIFINAGIYVLAPEALSLIPDSRPFDMTELFELFLKESKPTAVFPVREYWLDVGRIDDLHRANGEFEEYFR